MACLAVMTRIYYPLTACILTVFSSSIVLGQSPCSADINQDGIVSMSDLMLLLGAFGTTCLYEEAAGEMVISEIHYNPSFQQGQDTDWEFIELYNPSDVPVNLSGWRFASGIDFAFPDGLVTASHSFVVLAANSDSCGTLIPPEISAFTWETGIGLDNSEASIILERWDGSVADEVMYEDDDGWSVQPDGGGPSLSLMDAESENNAPDAWTFSLSVGGTPGSPNASWD
jgi:hypothetical protein